jgi:uncharacterized phage infection (PIP) family protein YhgE
VTGSDQGPVVQRKCLFVSNVLKMVIENILTLEGC